MGAGGRMRRTPRRCVGGVGGPGGQERGTSAVAVRSGDVGGSGDVCTRVGHRRTGCAGPTSTGGGDWRGSSASDQGWVGECGAEARGWRLRCVGVQGGGLTTLVLCGRTGEACGGVGLVAKLVLRRAGLGRSRGSAGGGVEGPHEMGSGGRAGLRERPWSVVCPPKHALTCQRHQGMQRVGGRQTETSNPWEDKQHNAVVATHSEDIAWVGGTSP
ncbi:hypothetical protein U9M48_044792 [Paspalum notatum var. saurae]|uniref:Uncharacterized protein n=1 Tax=Paspalum notatum var. saurae TaxID=547442 RepID=A0AAQ3UWE2_PASNO